MRVLRREKLTLAYGAEVVTIIKKNNTHYTWKQKSQSYGKCEEKGVSQEAWGWLSRSVRLENQLSTMEQCMHAQLFSRVQFFATPWTGKPLPGSSVHGIVQDCHFLLQGIFLIQGLLHLSGLFTPQPPGKCRKIIKSTAVEIMEGFECTYL